MSRPSLLAVACAALFVIGPVAAACNVDDEAHAGATDTPDGQTSGGKCVMKTGSCKSGGDCTCGASCGVVAECETCTKRCNFYCDTDEDCVKATANLDVPRTHCNKTGPVSGIKICQ